MNVNVIFPPRTLAWNVVHLPMYLIVTRIPISACVFKIIFISAETQEQKTSTETIDKNIQLSERFLAGLKCLEVASLWVSSGFWLLALSPVWCEWHHPLERQTVKLLLPYWKWHFPHNISSLISHNNIFNMQRDKFDDNPFSWSLQTSVCQSFPVVWRAFFTKKKWKWQGI